jgi:hypothetical protein
MSRPALFPRRALAVLTVCLSVAGPALQAVRSADRALVSKSAAGGVVIATEVDSTACGLRAPLESTLRDPRAETPAPIGAARGGDDATASHFNAGLCTSTRPAFTRDGHRSLLAMGCLLTI